MTNQNEANYLASKISQLKIVERSKKLEKSKKMISDVVVLYEEWKRTQSKRKFSNIINDYYTSSFQHSGAIITLHSFVDELKYINDFMKKIHD